METGLLLSRTLTMCILVMTLVVSRRRNGSSVVNLPYWMAWGMLFLYASYCLFGIKFANGPSALAELVLALLVAIGAFGFALGARRALLPASQAREAVASGHRLPRVGGTYTLVTAALLLVFFAVLTGGQPWRIFTDGVDLKWERLNAATEKNAGLLLLDALVFAAILVGVAWSIIAHRDDRRSNGRLATFVLLTLLYVLSTGSRTPLIAVALQIVGAVNYGRHHSKFVRRLSVNSTAILAVLLAGVAFMIAITASRIEFEDLSSAVFEIYFDITDLGAVDWLTQGGGAVGFFVATLLTYAASTFNNAVLRIQEIDHITLAGGYKFAFFYLSALQMALGGIFTDAIDGWRTLATNNNEHLLAIAPSATQWATLYGDAIWDFGITLTGMLVLIVSFLAGRIMRAAHRNPGLPIYLLAATVIGFSLSPLVNPFLSLHVHFMLFIVGGISLTVLSPAAHAVRRQQTERSIAGPPPTP